MGLGQALVTAVSLPERSGLGINCSGGNGGATSGSVQEALRDVF